MKELNMENANDHPFKVSIVKDAEFFANSHPYKVSIEGGGGGGNEGRVVDELPEEGEPGYIYLVLKEHTPEGDIYDEYMWVLQQDGETYGWEHIGATNEIRLGSIYTLTTADYNWNRATDSQTEPYNCIAIWLLESGVYTTDGEVTFCPVRSVSIRSANTIILHTKSTGQPLGYGKTIVFNGQEGNFYEGVNGGVAAFTRTLVNPFIEQTTGNNTQRLMSQKAITDAINAASGVERELSISDYDYFPDPNLGGVDLRDAPVGRYYTNEPNQALVRCYITSVHFVYLRKGENYLEVCETTNGIKTYKVRGYDTDGSVSYYDVDVANDTYKFQEYYAKGTVQDNLNSNSTVFALSANQGRVLKDMIDASGFKTLTTADYNYDYGNTGSNNTVALWLLDEGLYRAENGVNVSPTSSILNATDPLYWKDYGNTYLVSPTYTGGSFPGKEIIAFHNKATGMNGLFKTITKIYMGINDLATGTATIWDSDITQRNIADNLTTTAGNYVLSARQGKVLNDKIGQIETVLQTLTIGNGV